MHRLISFLAVFLVALSASAADSAFPGLRSVMTAAEWQRAGLDRLSPDELGVIDAALIRHLLQETARAVTPPPLDATPGTSPQENALSRSRFWERFGLGKSDSPSWRTVPPMKAKVTSWLGSNRFTLDTGQVWEGIEQIPYEILGATISIEARPAGAFALKLTDESVPVRVRRVR